ncbi:hypothetical protein [Sphingobium sp. MK2]|uniref:hypothetical protein n=1 Tax=Sphingobium sp. MK2 TaxID=3116540 RepID=UPI0032E35F3B
MTLRDGTRSNRKMAARLVAQSHRFNGFNATQTQSFYRIDLFATAKMIAISP